MVVRGCVNWPILCPASEVDMLDTLEPRSLERKNVKRLILRAAPAVDETHGSNIPGAMDTRQEELDDLEIIVEFRLDLMPEDFELGDLTTLKEHSDRMSRELSLVKHGPSGVVLAKRV